MFEKTPVAVESANTKTTEVTNEKVDKKEKKAKKPKVKKEKKGLSVAAFVVPLLFSVMLIVGLYVLIGNTTESATVTMKVMYAAVPIEKNAYIPAEEYANYFKVCETDVNLVPKTAISDSNVLPEKGLYVQNAVVENQMMLADDLTATDPIMNKYTSYHYTTSIATSSFKSSLSGRIRRGDIVNVYAKNENDTLTLFAQNVYVEKAFDANGKECTQDTDIAVSFNVWVTPEEVEYVNTAIMCGDIQLYLAE